MGHSLPGATAPRRPGILGNQCARWTPTPLSESPGGLWSLASFPEVACPFGLARLTATLPLGLVLVAGYRYAAD